MNNSSLAVSVKYLEHTIFLTGDMEELAWEQFDRTIQCQGYKIAHHGSPSGDPGDKVEIEPLTTINATYAIATEGPSKKYKKQFMPTAIVKKNLIAKGIAEIYSILYDRIYVEKVKNIIRPISYIFSIIPSTSGSGSRIHINRYYSIPKAALFKKKLVQQPERSYYTEDIANPIHRVKNPINEFD